MKLSTMVELGRHGRLGLMRKVQREVSGLHRASFLAGAASAGLLQALAGGTMTLEHVARRLEVPESGHAGLLEWLQTGVSLGLLADTGSGFALRGPLAANLAQPHNDDLLALVEEAATLHHTLLFDTPRRLREGGTFTLADQDGAIVARSSRSLEPLVREAIDEALPTRGPVRILEIGCGSGTYIRYCLQRNKEAKAEGLELQPQVAASARTLLAEHGLLNRAEVRHGDVRREAARPEFDLATLHNNIYYFPVDERVALLSHVRGFLAPNGRLLLTTACRGGSPLMAVLSLWGAATEGCGRLPDPDELVGQMKEAGFERPRAVSLIPGDSYYAFHA